MPFMLFGIEAPSNNTFVTTTSLRPKYLICINVSQLIGGRPQTVANRDVFHVIWSQSFKYINFLSFFSPCFFIPLYPPCSSFLVLNIKHMWSDKKYPLQMFFITSTHKIIIFLPFFFHFIALSSLFFFVLQLFCFYFYFYFYFLEVV